MITDKLPGIASSETEEIKQIENTCKRSGYSLNNFEFSEKDNTDTQKIIFNCQSEVTVTYKISKKSKIYQEGCGNSWMTGFLEDIDKRYF